MRTQDRGSPIEVATGDSWMKRTLLTAAFLISLCGSPSSANPEFRVSYPNGIPRVEINGDWRHSHYSVWRAETADGPFVRLGDADVLCVGPCSLDDYWAVGGRTYVYRFDLILPAGGAVSFGPYVATMARDRIRQLSATVTPNPGRGAADVTLFASGPPGTTTGVEAALFDLQGRRVRTFFHGPMTSGPTRLRWDCLDDQGPAMRAGPYLLRMLSWDGRSSVTRVARTR